MCERFGKFSVSSPVASDASIFIPESQSTERWIGLLIFLLTAGYLLVFRRYTTVDADEGIILQGAQRILQGEVLYRDFFSFYTPGSYYLLAILFKIFGSSFMTARTPLILFGGLFSGVTYLLARRVCRRSSALLTASLVSLTCLPYRFMALHNWDSTLFACLAVYCSVRLIESRTLTWAFAAGTFTSLTFIFEQSKGGGLAVGLTIGFLALSFLGQRRPVLTKVLLFALAAGTAWPMFATLAWFHANDSLQPMISAWLWPLQHYSVANRVPYGYQNWTDEGLHSLFGGAAPDVLISVLTVSPLFLVPFLPLVAIAQFMYWIIRTRRRTVPEEKGAYYVLITSALAGLLLSVVIGRADILHFMYLLPLFCLVLAWIIDGRDIPGRLFNRIKPAVNTYIVLAFLFMSATFLVRSLSGTATVQTARGEIRVPGEDTVIAYVRSHVAPGETLLVHPYLPLYYYLTGTFSPNGYEYLQPGLNTPEQFREALTSLSSRQVRVVLLESSFSQKIPNSWPNTPLSAILHDPVSDYVLKHYQTCKVLHSPHPWRFLFMTRKDLRCP